MKPVSKGMAIAIGLLWVNGPVLLFLAGPLLLLDALGVESPVAVLPAFAVGFLLAWLYWSFSVPRWRLWAYRRVDDIPDLKRTAVSVGLLWPDGHFFERTEIRTASYAERLREIERKKSATGP